MCVLLKDPDLRPLTPGKNQRDLFCLSRDGKYLDLWIIEAKGKEAGGFDFYCFAEALGQLFHVPAALLSALLGSERGDGHGRGFEIAERLVEGWRGSGLVARATLAVLVPLWGPDAVWTDRVSVRPQPYYQRPISTMEAFLESGSTRDLPSKTKGEARFAAVLEHVACEYRVCSPPASNSFCVLCATCDQAGCFVLRKGPIRCLSRNPSS